MRRMIKACAMAACCLMLLVSRSQAEDFSWRGDLPTGGVLVIRGIRGDITAEPAQGRRAEVIARKAGSAKQLEKVQVRVIEEGGQTTICAVYPGNDRCPGGRDQRRDNEKEEVTINFVVRVPAGVRLVADTEVGKVTAKSLAGPVEARTVMGDIQVSTSEHARAESVNGDIDITLGKTRWSGTVELETVNGDILVQLPAAAETEVRAETTNGSFQSDLFPVEENRYGVPGASVRGTLGAGGGRTLKIETTNGSIEVKRTR